MRRLFVLGLTISLLLISISFAMAAPCAGACGDEATCGGTACGDNECPCDTGGTCVCIDNECGCPAPCNDEKGCSGDCPTKDTCRPAKTASADMAAPEDSDHSPADGQDDGTVDIEAQTNQAADNSGVNDTDVDSDEGDEDNPVDTIEDIDVNSEAKKVSDVEEIDAEEETGSSALLYAGIAIFGGGALLGGFILFGGKKKEEGES